MNDSSLDLSTLVNQQPTAAWLVFGKKRQNRIKNSNIYSLDWLVGWLVFFWWMATFGLFGGCCLCGPVMVRRRLLNYQLPARPVRLIFAICPNHGVMGITMIDTPVHREGHLCWARGEDLLWGVKWLSTGWGATFRIVGFYWTFFCTWRWPWTIIYGSVRIVCTIIVSYSESSNPYRKCWKKE